MAERSEQELIRIAKLSKLREGNYPFPNDFRVTSTSAEVLAASTSNPPQSFSIAGRIVQSRVMGKAAFAHVLDGQGKIQVYLRQDELGAETFDKFKEFDLGDIVGCTGFPFVTKTGEKSLHVTEIRLLTKSLIPLPEKWHGLTDIEARYRYRYVDLISNPEVRQLFRTRSKIIGFIRRFLDDRNYTEVETPVLHYIPGGANAKPFATYYNTLDTQMYLRIALELPLKKLVVGGLERVYEIGKVFRNEGISKKHSPEFTMLEFYQAYATFEDLMTLTETLISELASYLNLPRTIEYGEKTIDLSTPWKRISMLDSVWEIGGVSRKHDLNTLGGVNAAAKEHGVELSNPEDWGMVLEELWGHLVEPKLINPTFITHHPFSISPLARKTLSDPKVTDRFELVIAGMEMANAFSELNDPQDQRERFETQAEKKKAGDETASDVDHDFLRALEHGLPPTAGEGIGIDRLTMLLTNSHTVRDVVLFPHLKPESE